MKKLTMTFLILAIVSVSLWEGYSLAADDYVEKSEELIIKVKELLNISDEYDKFTSSVSSQGNNSYYHMNWTDSKGKLNNLNVQADTEGNIIHYSSYPIMHGETQRLPNYTMDEAEKLAREFIGKIRPDIYKEIKLIEGEANNNYLDSYYYFDFVRYVNGIPFPQNTVNIRVNKYNYEIGSFNSNWEKNLDFPSPDNIISLEEGKMAFKKHIGIHPIHKSKNSYIPMVEGEEESKYFLAYSPITSNKAIDAFTGKTINMGLNDIIYGSKEMMAEDAGGVSRDSGLTPGERESIEKLRGIIDIKSAEKIARELLSIDPSYELKEKSLNKNYKNPDDYRWNLYFTNESIKDEVKYINISIDARSEKLLSFYKSMDHKPADKSKLNKDEALKIAKEYIEKMEPQKALEVELSENQYGERDELTYTFRFNRKINGIYVENDSIIIAIDGVRGEVYSYSLDWYKGQLPSTNNMISIDRAYEILWDKIGLELFYTKIHPNNGNEETEIKLIYNLNKDKPTIISAATGELLNHRGDPYEEKVKINYNDIGDSYAREKISTLGQYGIGFKEESFRPEAKIKQKDFLYLLWKASNPWSDTISEEELYKLDLIREGERNPEGVVTKEEGVKFIIRQMKLDKVADMDDIYKDIFNDSKDITKGLVGYMNIAYKLNIILGDGEGNIDPLYKLKREDAASIIYNYIFK